MLHLNAPNVLLFVFTFLASGFSGVTLWSLACSAWRLVCFSFSFVSVQSLGDLEVVMTLLIPIVSILPGFFTPLAWRCVAGVCVHVNLYGETTINLTIPQYSMIQVITISVISLTVPVTVIDEFQFDKPVHSSLIPISEQLNERK